MDIITDPAGRRFVAVLDVSGWQLAYAGNGRLEPGAKAPDLRKAKTLGVAGIIARIGNGTSFDHSFPLVAAAAGIAGLPLGAYYYAQPNRLDPAPAAELVIRWLDELDAVAGHGELPIMLDLEEYHGATLSAIALGAWTRRWLGRIAELDGGRRPILYAGAAFANENTIAGTLAGWDTIQPRYARGTQVPPVDPADWPAWIRWDREPRHTEILGDWEGYQFTSSGHWPSYGGPPDAATDRVDLNIIHEAAWQRWANPLELEWSPPMSALHMAAPARRIVDTRTDGDRKPVAADSTFTIPIPDDHEPGAAVVTVTVTQTAGPGHLVLWGDELPDPATSSLNYGASATVANTTLVAVGRDAAGGRVVRGMLRGAGAHIIVDLIAVIS